MNNRDNENKAPQRRMHGPNRGDFEKPKNLSLTVKKLFSYLKSFMPFIIIALIFAAAFVVLALFTYVVYIPIRKITHAADEYSKGNFDAKIDVHSNDEIGYLAASLNYMANELNTLEEDQRKFISNVSHDFRSPLTSIKGYVEAMLDGTIPVEMQEKYLKIILLER